jgi:O-antigen/teichoic acid export membrane protein
MGIVIKQSVRSTVYSYAGAFLGFLTVWFLNRIWLTPEQNGLVNILISLSLVTGSLINLGTGGAIARLFPHFRDQQSSHKGFIALALLVTCVGFALFLLLFFGFRDELISRNMEKSRLLADHIYWLVPLTFFMGVFYILDAFSRAIFLTSAAILIKEIVLRIVILLAGWAYYKGWISFEIFLTVYVLSFCSMSLALAVWMWLRKDLRISPPRITAHKSHMRKEIVYVSFFTAITSMGALLLTSVDKIMINEYLGLAAAGVFAVVSYLGSMIQIPARSVGRVAMTVIAESWKNHDLENIASVYRKTSINQCIAGCWLFLVIACCANQIISLMPDAYAMAGPVIQWVGLAYLVEVSTGANATIIGTSRYYKFDTILMLVMIPILALLNSQFIPSLGINGAGLSMFLCFFIINACRFYFILKKFKMQPFDGNVPKILVLSLFVYAAFISVNPEWNAYAIIMMKAAVITAVFFAAILWLKVSDDFNQLIFGWIRRLGNNHTSFKP